MAAGQAQGMRLAAAALGELGAVAERIRGLLGG